MPLYSWTAKCAIDVVMVTHLSLRCETGFIPVCSLGVSQVGRMNFGKDVSTLKFFTICGLQEGYEPFAVNMNRDVTMWLSKRLPQFIPVLPGYEHIEVFTHTHSISHAVFSAKSHTVHMNEALVFLQLSGQIFEGFTYSCSMNMKILGICIKCDFIRFGLN